MQSWPQQVQLRLVTWHHQKQGYTGRQAAHLVNGRLPPGLLLFCNHQLISCSLQHSRTAHLSWESLAGRSAETEAEAEPEACSDNRDCAQQAECKYECCMTEAGRGAQEAFETSFMRSLMQQDQRCYTGLQEEQAHATGFTQTDQTRLTCSCSAAWTTSACDPRSLAAWACANQHAVLHS